MNVLFVEDDQTIALCLVYSLEKEKYNVTHCLTKGDAIKCLDKNNYDILLLDVSLPDGNGYEICQYAKQIKDVPVIFLTAMDDEANVVMGLDIGGDDYVTKPFRINELLSRMNSVLRRYHKDINKIINVQYIQINLYDGKVYKENEEIFLTALEYRLLMVFVNHIGQILTRTQLLDGLWDIGGDFVNDNTLSVYIKRLREKLEIDPREPQLIVTVRGIGYRLER